ncbi:MBL fold metallo-hydrolase [Metallosphaera sedula]|uniref:MBL fold metallo-hydrolase n=1 Tax=Metallosphaera sedula TaxID=43687 RepID=UPI0020BEE3B2|nr:MBL fold metallo-hydrolase [Metallosphaera sedula]BBL46632.1 metallo-beta-lactamase [Metallosphaera sedula]
MIRLHGHSMISIGDFLVIDPHDGGSIGLPRPVMRRAEYVFMTHDHYDHNAFQIIESKEKRTGFTGTFSSSGYSIQGIRVNHDRNGGKSRGKTSIYTVKIGNLSFVHMGDIGEYPRESLIKDLAADMLALPVGGVITIDGKEASQLVKEISPSVVIPMHYWVKGHLMPLDPPDEFLNLTGLQVYLENEIDENNLKKGIYLYKP